MKTAVVNILIFLVYIVHVSSGQCAWNAQGAVKWSSPSSWPNGVVPALGSDVIINNGTTMIYDLADPAMNFSSITVSSGAQFVFDGTQDLLLTTNYVWVQVNASFIIGTADCPYTKKAIITLYGAPNKTFSVDGMGNKAIINKGIISFFGNVPVPTWTTLTKTANVNSTQLFVKDQLVNWNVGDSIVVASTDYYQSISEQFTIVAISGQTITVDRPLTYMHWGANNEFAEVGLLTRNIVIQGDISSENTTYGGHCINYQNGTAQVFGVEFTRMGQAGFIGRYPFHFHVQLDQSGKGNTLSDNSFHHGYQRCCTVHGTSGVLIRRNVCFNVTGHGYFMEEGSEMNNVYDGNLGIMVNPGKLIPSDSTPSVYWITNPNNTIINNVAVGGNFGFWYALPAAPLGLTKYMTWIKPRQIPLAKFDNNVAHSSSQSCVFMDNGPTDTGDTSFVNLYGAYDEAGNQVRARFTNIIAYKCREYGIWIRAQWITVSDALLMDNSVGVNLPVYGNVFANSTIVGETDNIGTPNHTPFYNEYGRSRPRLWWLNYPIRGFEVYDNGGEQYCENVTFINFVSDNIRYAGAVGGRDSGFFILPPTDIITKSTLINSNVWAQTMNTGPWDGPSHNIVHDADGTLTGEYGSFIVSNNSLAMFDSDCTLKPEWGPAPQSFYLCKMHRNGYGHVSVVNMNIPATNYGDSLSQWWKATFYALGHPETADFITGGDPREVNRMYYDTNVYTRMGYYIRFPHPTPPSMQVNLRYGASGEWVVFVLSYPAGTTFNVTRDYANTVLPPVNSLDQLTWMNYYFDSANEWLYVMYQQDDGGLVSADGFPMYAQGHNYVNIQASCGRNCQAKDSSIVPPALVDNEDKYRASMTGCAAGTGSATYKGEAFFSYSPSLKRMYYNVYHNIPDATYAIITSEQSGIVYKFSVPQSPMKGLISLSWASHNQLWNGNWTITIRSDDGSQSISGVIGCAGVCSAPPMMSAVDPCAAVQGEAPVFTDAFNSTIGWYDWSWTATRNYSYSDAMCGTKAAQVTFGAWGSFSFHAGNGGCYPAGAPNACNAYWQKPFLDMYQYKYLQFHVKVPDGTNYQLYARAQNQNDTQVGQVTIKKDYIDNYRFDNNWSRVRIPIADLGFVPGKAQYAGTFGIFVQGISGKQTFVFDQIKLVPEYDDPLTKPPAGVQSTYAAPAYKANTCSPLPPTQTPTNTPTPTQPAKVPTTAGTNGPTTTRAPTPTPTTTRTPTTAPTAAPTTAPTTTRAATAAPTTTRAATTAPTVAPTTTRAATTAPTTTRAPTAAPTTAPTTTRSPTAAPTAQQANGACGNLQACGTACYNPQLYTCYDGFLCANPSLKCGQSCYDPSTYACVNSKLAPLAH